MPVATTTAPPIGGPQRPPDAADRLYSDDLAPTSDRSWGTYSIFAMWMSDVHSIGGYTFAAGLLFLGLASWVVGIAMLVGVGIVVGLMLLSGRAGQRLGVPYPVIARVSFGVLGANLPALIRAVIGTAGYGIQTYLASAGLRRDDRACGMGAVRGRLRRVGNLSTAVFGGEAWLAFFTVIGLWSRASRL